MNWASWCQAAITAICQGLLTAVLALATLDNAPKAWQFFVIAGVPAIVTFLSFIKDHPPPIGNK